MTDTPNNLAIATNRHVAADRALGDAIATYADRATAQKAWDVAKAARHAYAAALEAEGHFVPHGLVWDK